MIKSPAVPVSPPADSNSIREGLKDSIPFCVLFVFYGVSFGMFCANNGLGAAHTLAIVTLIFSTPLQFIIAQDFTGGWLLAPVILAMNARFLLMSATLAPYFRTLKLSRTLICGPGHIQDAHTPDETIALDQPIRRLNMLTRVPAALAC